MLSDRLLCSFNWRRYGKIFDPKDHNLRFSCGDFAQSPQVILFDKFIRVYFCTRLIENSSRKYLSHVAYVDYDRSFEKLLRVSTDEVIPLGQLGAFDEHGIFPFSPMVVGERVLAYTCGWSRRVSVSVDTSIGMAESFDNGETFVKYGNGPVLTASLDEPFLVNDAFVRKFNDLYYCWYSYGTRWLEHNDGQEPDRVYKLGYAVSNDGIDWKKMGVRLVPDLFENECQALPTVIYFNGLYHMCFTYRHATDFRKNPTRGYRLGYAYSTDLVNWKRVDSGIGLHPSVADWDSEMMCYPHLFTVDDRVFLLYNGNEFGKRGFGLAELQIV